MGQLTLTVWPEWLGFFLNSLQSKVEVNSPFHQSGFLCQLVPTKRWHGATLPSFSYSLDFLSRAHTIFEQASASSCLFFAIAISDLMITSNFTSRIILFFCIFIFVGQLSFWSSIFEKFHLGLSLETRNSSNYMLCCLHKMVADAQWPVTDMLKKRWCDLSWTTMRVC